MTVIFVVISRIEKKTRKYSLRNVWRDFLEIEHSYLLVLRPQFATSPENDLKTPPPDDSFWMWRVVFYGTCSTQSLTNWSLEGNSCAAISNMGLFTNLAEPECYGQSVKLLAQ